MVADALKMGKRARDDARRLVARGVFSLAPAIAGGSGPAVRLFMWMAQSAGAACDACGKPIHL